MLHAEKIILNADQQGVIHGLPKVAPYQKVEIILLVDDVEPAVFQPLPQRRKPSPRLANQGAQLHGDDMAPAIPLADWGAIYNSASGDPA
jgi:hypothetical protein